MSQGASGLVEEHLGLIKTIALSVFRRIGGVVELDELVALGAAGLLEAGQRFDPRQGVTFSTFAYWRVRGAIIDGLRGMGRLTRPGKEALEASERATQYLDNLAARDPGTEKPSVEADLRALHDALEGVAVTYMASLDAAMAKGIEFADHDAPRADARIESEQRASLVREAVAGLPDKERHFIEKFYFEGKTLVEAGEELGLSKSWASRMHARAVDRLKKRLLARPPP